MRNIRKMGKSIRKLKGSRFLPCITIPPGALNLVLRRQKKELTIIK